MVIGIGVGVLLAIAWLFVAHWWERRPRRPKGSEWCGACGKELSGRRIHLLVSQPSDEVEAEFGGFGGTFVSMAFCGDHCPGGCRNTRCRVRLDA